MIKRVTAIFTALAMCGITSVASTRIPADVNGDGKINTADVVEVYNVILNMREATSITIGDFLTTGWSDDETIGTADEGKTAWAEGDVVTLSLNSPTLGEKTYMLTYGGENWAADTEIAFTYLANEDNSATAVYFSSGETGTVEYLEGECTIDEGKIIIDFTNTKRTYSRIRIATTAGLNISVITNGFTPTGTSEAVAEGTSYSLTADEKGNAYLYGTFAAGATLTIKIGDATLAEHTFETATEAGKSYALDARPVIDGTLGGKTEATEDDITALVEKLKEYVDNGITTIIVTGSNPAMITITGNSYPYTTTAIGEAILRLSKDESYNGKIDLTLPDVTEIVDQEFYAAFALNSITLPKVTTVGDGAFAGCYYLKKMTFDSVVKSINQSTTVVFYMVGEYVEGCDLVLNREQVNAEADYQPNIETSTWWNTEWKSIELI